MGLEFILSGTEGLQSFLKRKGFTLQHPNADANNQNTINIFVFLSVNLI